MASLSAHLSRPEDHARLSFHAGCPQCRQERLAGSLAPASLVPRRAQAAFTAGVLAISAVAPSTAFASGQDQVVEGGATEEVATGDFEPGGDSTQLGQDAGEDTEDSVAA